MIARIVLTAALVAGAAVTLAGLSAPLHPPADIVNPFRPFILLAAGALLAIALMLRAPRLALAGAALAGINGMLLGLPLLWSAVPAERSTAGQALASAGTRDINLVTFNMAFRDAQATVRFLLDEDPDIAVLQEVGTRQGDALRASLGARYPHSHTCGAPRRCAAAILAKRPWVAAGHEEWTAETPEVVWVQFDDPELGRLRVVGAHLALPFRAEQQTNHVARLIALRAGITGPLVIAGDFNMTPWSYRLQRLLAATGLRRHATFLRSWPTDGQYRLPRPTFLIDHVLTTPEIESVSIRIGPALGSDHLPVIAALRVPKRRQ
ncbi:MAG: endonuclease/exonuclease/phosphatase family protein [Hyphomicrobiaceae bacterium]